MKAWHDAANQPRLRQIIKEPAFELALRNIIEKPREADAFIEAAGWSLARRPEIGTRVATDPPVWFLPMILEERIERPLILFYTFDAERVYFLHIQYAILEEPN